MTGPEHYQEAERLITLIEDGDAGDTMLSEAQLNAMAQVHATLALAAATAMATYGSDAMHHEDFAAWDKACGVKPGDTDG